MSNIDLRILFSPRSSSSSSWVKSSFHLRVVANKSRAMNRRLRRALNAILGPIFGITILITSLFGDYIITIFTPIIFFDQHKLWRSVMDRAVSYWMLVPLTFLRYIFHIDVRVTGDSIEGDKPAIVVMNHRTRVDWLFLWIAIYKINPWLLTTSKYSMKAQLRNLPGAGFGMAANQFIFLERKIDEDKRRLSEAIEYYSKVGSKYQILIFPEGTDKTNYTTKKSNEYAKKNGLKELSYLLYPRSGGLTHMIEKMRQCNYINCIYDVTIAYPDNVVQNELELVLKGKVPKAVHFDIRRIDISQVPKNANEMNNWINSLWIAKEAKLAAYYAKPKEHRNFDSGENGFVWELIVH
uniref:PlsC domain-containing protein n=1 Tax=Syphacia muris TaxID=451379 RepID=A0A0N5AAR5_9BILA